MKIAFVGTGYLGTTTAACLAELGHVVVGIDVDAKKIASLSQGIVPFHEPGLPELVQKHLASGALRFTTSLDDAIPGAQVVFIGVGTPDSGTGQPDMSYVESSARAVAERISEYTVIAIKSTVPVGTNERIREIVSATTAIPFDIVSNPEFLAEGRAVRDTLEPTRTLIGSTSVKAIELMKQVYASVSGPVMVMDPASVELAKYASNAFLATKVSFINEISHICEESGADVHNVAIAMSADPRIGKEFLRAGPGWGGGCFPKDVRGLLHMGKSYGLPMHVVLAAHDANQHARERVADRIHALLAGPSRIALLGLSFKANTDDTRDSPAIGMAHRLVSFGHEVIAYDPVARIATEYARERFEHREDPYEAATGAHAVVIATEWSQFKEIDFARLRSVMAGDLFVDTRNIVDPEKVRSAGFRYARIGTSNQ